MVNDNTPFGNYLNSVAKLDRYMRNLIKINKDLSDTNRQLRQENIGLMVRYEAQTRILERADNNRDAAGNDKAAG